MSLVPDAHRRANAAETAIFKSSLQRVLELVAYLNGQSDAHVVKVETTNHWMPAATGVTVTVTFSVYPVETMPC